MICSDKTGTLTKNEMTVRAVVTYSGEYEVQGVGYNPVGDILFQNLPLKDVPGDEALMGILRTSLWCNDAKIIQNENQVWTLIGDPTEGALISLGRKAAFDLGQFQRKDVLPFNSDHKYMAVMGEHGGDPSHIYVKGAPEKILQLCKDMHTHDGVIPTDMAYWENRIEALAEKGQRVIAFAFKETIPGQKTIDHKDLSEGLIFLGICGMIDPPCPEVKEAIKLCHNAGIAVKMITGDHALTARNIGQKLNIANEHGAITGAQLDDLSEEEWLQAVLKYNIFARTTPEHKLKLVTALQQHHFITAMTGDGVNDAPALKRSNIGIAMGIKGTEVTKDASEMVLADDNFTSISEAVKLGRTTFENIKKAIMFILPTNGAEAFVIMFSIITGTSTAITASQILWINMVTAVTLGLALAFEPSERHVMKRPPRNANEPILDKYLMFRIVTVSLFLGGMTILLYRYLRGTGMDLDYARTIAVNTLVMGEAFYLLNCRYLRDNVFHRGFFSNVHVFYSILTLIGLQFMIIYVPFMQNLFGTVGISPAHWGMSILCGLALFIFVEIEKFIYSRFTSS
jgi:calcium-translocating P-type ATPase